MTGYQDAVSIHAQMEIVRQDGLKAARHLVEDLYEVEAHGVDSSLTSSFISQRLVSVDGAASSRRPTAEARTAR